MLELLVVLGLGAGLLMLALPSYALLRQEVAVDSYADQIVSALHTAQSQSMASQGGVVHGVHFNTTSYVLYAGNWSAPTSPPTTYNLGSGMQIFQGANSEVEFNHLTGSTNIPAGQTIVVGVTGGNQETIVVSSTGQVSIQ